MDGVNAQVQASEERQRAATWAVGSKGKALDHFLENLHRFDPSSNLCHS